MTLLALSAGGAAATALFNKYIKITAVSKNLMNRIRSVTNGVWVTFIIQRLVTAGLCSWYMI